MHKPQFNQINRSFFFFLLFIGIFLGACQSDSNESSQSKKTSSTNFSSQFTKLSSAKTGIDFKNVVNSNIQTKHNVFRFAYFYNGSGVAIGDINNDGLSDLIFTANQGPNKLYLNKGDLKFEDISVKSKINQVKGWSTGVTMADVNNDGWLDIYICQAGPDNDFKKRRNLLFINNKNNTFTEQAQQYGLADPKLGIQAAFFDYNKDGLLDCYVMNESIYAKVYMGKVFEELQDPQKLWNASGTLYKNVNGKFVDATREAGVLNYGYGLGLSVSDFNNDSWPDFYVSNDYSVPDFMWINQKDGTFKDEIKNRTDQISWFSMGTDVADINNDGHLDIGVVDMAADDHVYGKTLMAPMNPKQFELSVDILGYQRQHMFNVLQMNEGNGHYSNMAGIANVQKSDWSWSALFADLDNDGDKDYYVTNGYKKCARDNDFTRKHAYIKQQYNGEIPIATLTQLYKEIPSYKTQNRLFENQGFADFKNVAQDWGLKDLSFSNGAAYGDLDNDGDLDLIVNNIDEEAFVYRNNAQNNYLRIQLKSKSISYGTRVSIYHNGEKQIQEYNPVRGYASKSEDYLHFGLGEETNIDSLVVVWPDRKTQKLTGVTINQLLALDYSQAQNKAMQRKTIRPVFAPNNNQPNFTHSENEFNDFEKEVLVPYKQSALGPFMTFGDVNGDGLEDVFIGGAKDQAGALMLQQADGSWKTKSAGTFAKDKASEDMKSTFFDADKDGDDDLYVVSGGNEFDKGSALLQDRLYINNGKGDFSKSTNKIPNIKQSGMQVCASDYDQDGDMDLFVSGRIETQKYPYSVQSTILQNNNGKFKDLSADLDSTLTKAGIINDAVWVDVDKDGDDDLIIAGEWTAPKLFKNNNGQLEPSNGFDKEYLGWWYSLKAVDIDNDGDQDLIAGNLGLNSKFSASTKKPFTVYADDFDNNGTCDVVLSKLYKGKEVPVRGRQCSSEQMPFITDKFKTYNAFANASLTDILGENQLKSALHLSANTFESAVFINDGTGNFKQQSLPRIAQAFPIFGISTMDLNNDNFQDLILTGNLYEMEIETPRLDAGKGLVLINDTKGNFTPLSAAESGLLIKGDLRDAIIVNSANDKPSLLVSRNNDSVVSFRLNR